VAASAQAIRHIFTIDHVGKIHLPPLAACAVGSSLFQRHGVHYIKSGDVNSAANHQVEQAVFGGEQDGDRLELKEPLYAVKNSFEDWLRVGHRAADRL
jgi:hypothetical protein